MPSSIVAYDDVLTVTPTITAGAYTTGMQLGGLQTISAFRNIHRDFDQPPPATPALLPNYVGGKSLLTSVLIIDKDKQNAAIDFYIFNQSPTISSSDHATADISYAECQTKLMGIVSGGVTYAAMANVSASETSNFNVWIKQYSLATTQNLFIFPVIRASATYTSTTSLTFLYKYMQD